MKNVEYVRDGGRGNRASRENHRRGSSGPVRSSPLRLLTAANLPGRVDPGPDGQSCRPLYRRGAERGLLAKRFHQTDAPNPLIRRTPAATFSECVTTPGTPVATAPNDEGPRQLPGAFASTSLIQAGP